jgi:hypothetical protein
MDDEQGVMTLRLLAENSILEIFPLLIMIGEKVSG